MSDLDTIKIGKGALIAKYCEIGAYLEIGDYSHIQRNCLLYSGKDANLKIGKHTDVGAYSFFFPANHPIQFPSHNSLDTLNWDEMHSKAKNKSITIGNNVWIGARTTVLAGVNIGDGAVIGAGSVVVKDIPPFAIAVGNPAKVVKYRFSKKIIKELMNLKWWDWSKEKIKRNEKFFYTDLTKYKGDISDLIVE